MSATLGRLPWRRFLQAIERRFAFTCASNVVAASLVLAMAGGCLSLWLGQDANWDLRNYHLYNGYAALQGRLSLDLAPAQMQSYFSPVLDVFHYLLMTVLPGPVAGFVLGVLHGLLFVPVAGIAWQVLQGRAERAWLAPLLAVAGLCTGTVLAGFGNTMADNTTALFVLGSVWLVLRGQSQGKAGTGVWLGAGTLIGIAVALKLTNAIYAVGLAAAVLVAVRGWGQRLRALLLVTLAALAVAALVTGWWYWQLWQMHGNPLLPQFNAVFQSNMAALVGISDTRWLPRNPGEHLVWPLLFTFNPKRVSEISLLQGGWALLYVSGFVLLCRRLLRGRRAAQFGPVLVTLLVFFLVSYVLWQFTFSIHRYLSALELLVPLLLWCACVQLMPGVRGMRIAGWALLGCALVSLVGRADWRHEPWANVAFEVQQPQMTEPADSVVLLVGGEPQAWRVPLLPAAARYASVASNFPESEGYRQHLVAMLAERSQHFALIPGSQDEVATRFLRLNAKVQHIGLDREAGCGKLQWLARHLKGLRADVQQRQGHCMLVPRAGAERSAQEIAAAEREAAQARLAPYGLMLQPDSCVGLASRIGTAGYPYQWCRLQVLR